MTEHTPGPWHVWQAGKHVVIKAGSLIIGSVRRAIVGGEQQANAHLIAAAPELLEALKFVIRGVPDTWEGVQKARAAIAKATGEQP